MGASRCWRPAALTTPVPGACCFRLQPWISMEPRSRNGLECLKAACPPSSRISRTSGLIRLTSWVDPDVLACGCIAVKGDLLLETLRSHVPVRIGAEAAVLADEHLAGFLVALEGPLEPVRGDIGELAAAGMKDRRGVAGVVPGAIKRGQVVNLV